MSSAQSEESCAATPQQHLASHHVVLGAYAVGDRKSRKDRKEERKARKGGGGASGAGDGAATAVPTAEELAAVNARSKNAPRTYVRVCRQMSGQRQCAAVGS